MSEVGKRQRSGVGGRRSGRDRSQKSAVYAKLRRAKEVRCLRKATPCQGGRRTEDGGQKSEDGKGQKSDVRGQPSTQSYAVPRMSEGQEQETAVYAKLRRAKEDGKVREKGLLIELGIPENEIIEECRSKDTSENARYAKQIIDPQITQINADLKMKNQRTYKIIEKRGFKAPILVTSAYHIKRAVFLFEKQGMKVKPFPCDLKNEEEEKEFDILDFLPRASVLEESSKALKEYMGLMAARVGIW